MVQELLEVALLAALPVSEVRGALPYGVLVRNLPFSWVVIVSFVLIFCPFSGDICSEFLFEISSSLEMVQ